MINKDTYKRLTKKGGYTKDLDLKQELGYSYIYTRLSELEDKIMDGTLVELPCKVRDTVWYIKDYGFSRYRVEHMTVAGFNFSRDEAIISVVGTYEEQTSKIFKTKAEAEAKLKELQENKK